MKVRWILGALIPFLLAGCAWTEKVAEVDVRLGKLVHKETRFYAYSTPLKSTRGDEIPITISGRETITGRKLIHSPDPQAVYPAVAYYPSRTFVKPELLEKFSSYRVAPKIDESKIHRLGYFQKPIGKGGSSIRIFSDIQESEIDGVQWAEISKDEFESLQLEIERFRAFAARYGADAIIDLVVYAEFECENCRNSGVYIQAQAIAYLE